MNADTGGCPPEPSPSSSHEQVIKSFASHAGRAHEERAELAARTVSECPALSYVSHHTNGLLDFEIRHGRAGCEHRTRIIEDFEAVPPSDRTVSLQISYLMGDLDRQLRDTRTGDLIRLVVHCSTMAVFCGQIVPGEYVVAIAQVSDATDDRVESDLTSGLNSLKEVNAADRAVSTLVDAIRELLSQESQNLGGWLTSQPDEHPTAPLPTGSADPRRIQREGSETAALALLEDLLGLEGPHFLALFTSGVLRARVDLLDDEHLQSFAVLRSAASRRQIWTDLGLGFFDVRQQLEEILRAPGAGGLVRLVLDVERGAVYVHPVSEDTYLIGATLKQRRVSQTDAAISDFVLRNADLLRNHETGPTS